MAVDVSSAFASTLRSKNVSNVSRYVTIGGSDYSERVLKWPRLSWSYEDVRPKSVKLDFANTDNGMAFFRNDKTTMQNEVVIGLSATLHAIEDYTLENLALTDVYSIGEITGAYEVSGTFDITSGGEYIIGVDDATDSLFKLRTLVPYQVNCATLVDSLNVEALGLPRPRSLAFDQLGNNLFVLDSTNAAVHHFVTSSHILGSATLVGSLATSMATAAGLAVNSDASMMMVYDSSALRESVHTFVMASPGSLSTASETAVYSLATDGLSMNTMAVNDEFTRAFFIGGGTPGHMRMYNMTQPGSLGNAVLDPSTGDTQGLTGQNGGDALAVARGNDNFFGFVRFNTFYTLSNTQGLERTPSQISSFTATGQEFDTGLGSTSFYNTFIVPPGGETLIGMWEGPAGAIYKYTMSPPYDPTSMTLVGAETESVLGYDSGMRGIAMTRDGSKFILAGDQHDRLYEFSVLSNYSADSMTLVNTISLSADGITVPGGIAINSDASWLLVQNRANNTVYEYALSTPGNITTATLTGQTLVYSYDAAGGFAVNEACNRLYLAPRAGATTSCWIEEFSLPTPGSLAGASLSSVLTLTTSDILPYALGFAQDRQDLFYLFKTQSDVIATYVNSIPALSTTVEQAPLFTGTVSRIAYGNEALAVTAVDKFKQLADRKIGTPDQPVDYTTSNYLVSDVAWYICTSYGGLSALTSSANPDINYSSFSTWAEVFSGDSTLVKGLFDGQSCMEALRKIARVTHSSIFVEAGKLKFKRVGLANTVVDSYGNSELEDCSLSFETEDIINRQLVAGGYDVSSGFGWTITQEVAASVNSFGPRESLQNDQNVWYITSGTAINHAQRSLILTANPDDRLRVKTGLRGYLRSVADTMTIVDSFNGIAGDYVAHGVELDLDEGRSIFDLRAIVVKNPFRLDVSSLDTQFEVLT